MIKILTGSVGDVVGVFADDGLVWGCGVGYGNGRVYGYCYYGDGRGHAQGYSYDHGLTLYEN